MIEFEVYAKNRGPALNFYLYYLAGYTFEYQSFQFLVWMALCELFYECIFRNLAVFE